MREYWVVDLKSRSIDVHRSSDGRVWTSVTRFLEGDRVALEVFPEVSIDLGAVLPTRR